MPSDLSVGRSFPNRVPSSPQRSQTSLLRKQCDPRTNRLPKGFLSSQKVEKSNSGKLDFFSLKILFNIRSKKVFRFSFGFVGEGKKNV